MKTVELASQKKVLHPFKVYCYQGITPTLIRLFNQTGFYDLCEHWRVRSIDGKLTDVYDGRIWHEFQSVSGKPFLASPCNLAFCLNVDWFQPYSLTQSSVGVLYLTILNLPCHIRYNRQYTMLVGIIPGPHEPKRDINSYLGPMVDDLLSLWKGVVISISSFSQPKVVRGALICVACDIPAARKVAGFLSHSATLGCSKCLKEFSGGFGQKDYSGFNCSSWSPRSNEQHRAAIKRIQLCSNKTQCQKLESECGCRYSVLLKLDYFDPVRMIILDPMHNLFLGSAKHVMKELWLSGGILTQAKLLKMQEFTDSFHVPPDCGRIPRKLESAFSGLILQLRNLKIGSHCTLFLLCMATWKKHTCAISYLLVGFYVRHLLI